jgi:hypothetical protein
VLCALLLCLLACLLPCLLACVLACLLACVLACVLLCLLPCLLLCLLPCLLPCLMRNLVTSEDPRIVCLALFLPTQFAWLLPMKPLRLAERRCCGRRVRPLSQAPTVCRPNIPQMLSSTQVLTVKGGDWVQLLPCLKGG